MKQVFVSSLSLFCIGVALLSSFFPQAALGQEQSIANCESIRSKITDTCLKASNQANPTREKIAECSISGQQEYDRCVKGLPSDHIEPDRQFEVPSADSLNQFQGLTIQKVIGNFIRIATGIMGSIAFAIMVIAGIMWMTAGGNSDRQRKALNMMIWASLGIIVILSSYTIARFLLDAYAN